MKPKKQTTKSSFNKNEATIDQVFDQDTFEPKKPKEEKYD